MVSELWLWLKWLANDCFKRNVLTSDLGLATPTILCSDPSCGSIQLVESIFIPALISLEFFLCSYLDSIALAKTFWFTLFLLSSHLILFFVFLCNVIFTSTFFFLYCFTLFCFSSVILFLFFSFSLFLYLWFSIAFLLSLLSLLFFLIIILSAIAFLFSVFLFFLLRWFLSR